ncbi:MAG: ATP-binding protein [Bacillus subtilis]|nr:ATP-binding protein [Bacillus subtilis]
MLSNYLSNAIHHVDHHKRIIIRSYLDARRPRSSSKSKTSGRPIKRFRLANGFGKVFTKSTKPARAQYGGQGLGLSIVRTTLTLLGYRYGVATTPHTASSSGCEIAVLPRIRQTTRISSRFFV